MSVYPQVLDSAGREPQETGKASVRPTFGDQSVSSRKTQSKTQRFWDDTVPLANRVTALGPSTV